MPPCHLPVLCCAVPHLPVNILAEAGGQSLCPQDEVTVMTQGVHDQFILLIFRILAAVNQHHDIPLEQEQQGGMSPWHRGRQQELSQRAHLSPSLVWIPLGK